MELPGYGYSEKPTQYSYAIEAAQHLAGSLSGLVVSEPNFHPGGGFFSQQIVRVSEDEWLLSAKYLRE
ncbi:hypothetical protein [Phytobacter sp. V91]|uniref:hypothetical protein n=1 Tax=Phytobacter sp. V91 TaxID=3369425 RepID=UPI003F63EFE8